MPKTDSKGPKKYIAVADGKGKKHEIKTPLAEEPKVDGKVFDGKIVEENGFTYVVWKNKKYNVQILDKYQNKYHILLNGVSHNITIETPISYRRRRFLDKNKSASKVEQITAPMPGKIVEIHVEAGDKLKEGDPVITLEAMKMQNEIITHVGGQVKSIDVKVNDSVMKDHVLIEINK